MEKSKIIELVSQYGDATINYRSLESNKVKYNVCTLDFDCPHIQNKTNKSKETDDTVLLFCWDTDSYRLIRPAQVTSVVPLSEVLKNV